MPDPVHATLGAQAARQLANTTKTPPQWAGVTPRWLVSLLPWTPVEAGTYRVNKVKEGGEQSIGIECSPSDAADIPAAFVDYEEQPREYTLSTVTTTIEVQTRISDLYRSPMDQVREQLAVLIEMVKERQESELVNNATYGLLTNAASSMRIATRAGAPTPDDLDELISKVWKEPAFFVAHPRAIAAFGRECTFRGVPPPTVTLFGSPFITWRGIPSRALPTSSRSPRASQRARDDQHLAHPHGREEAWGSRAFSARHSWRSQPKLVGPLDGHQPTRRGLVSALALLFGGDLDR
jgi:hypothetical protein